jgi:hypothetical protein
MKGNNKRVNPAIFLNGNHLSVWIPGLKINKQYKMIKVGEESQPCLPSSGSDRRNLKTGLKNPGTYLRV